MSGSADAFDGRLAGGVLEYLNGTAQRQKTSVFIKLDCMTLQRQPKSQNDQQIAH